MAHSFIELDKGVVHVISLVNFCDCDLHSVCLWWIRIRGLWKFPAGRDWLTEGWYWVLLWWAGPCSVNLESWFLLMVGLCSLPVVWLEAKLWWGNEDNGNFLQKVWCRLCLTQCTGSLCHTQVSAPRALILWQAPVDLYLLRRHSNPVWLSLCGVSGSWYAQGLFEPSESLLQVRSFILNTSLASPMSCWTCLAASPMSSSFALYKRL